MDEVDAAAVTDAFDGVQRPADRVGEDAMARRLEARLFDATGEPTTIGRFEIVRTLGHGGGGTVYEAIDPSLERHVAVKVLLPRDVATTGGDQDTRTRTESLRREAKTLAKLAHPNLVRVYEIGESDDGMFVVMELVQGTDLRAWRRGEGKTATARTLLDILAQAGRGLAAAHEQGIVHGDIKPANILLAKGGRAQLADFGLARMVDVEPAEGRNVVAGTPAYMAPEQHAGRPADVASDVFSFCATAHAVLTGSRPYEGSSFLQLADRKRAGPPATGRRAMPGHVWRMLQRGMAADPSQRPDAIATVVAALARRRPSLVVLASGGIAMVVLGVTLVSRPEAEMCEGSERHLTGVWDDDVRDAVRAVYVADGGVPGERAWSELEAKIDEYSAAWVAMHRESCEATHVHGEQSPDLLDRREACLEGRLASLQGLVTVLREVTPSSYLEPTALLQGLGDLDVCTAEAVLEAPASVEDDDVARARLARMTAADARLRLGDYARAAEELVMLGTEAEEAGNLRQAAAALRQGGIALEQTGDAAAGEATLRRAILVAERAGADAERLETYVVLARLITRNMGRGREALILLDQAAAILERPEHQDSAVAPPYHDARAAALRSIGDPRGALAQASLALEGYRARYGERDFRVARALNQVGMAAMALHELDRAEAALSEALALDRALLGDTHPHLMSDLINLSGVLVMQRRLDEGIAMMAEARRVTLLHYPDGHAALGTIAFNLGEAHFVLEDYERSIASFREAVQMRTKFQPSRVADARSGLGRVLTASGRRDEAIVELEQALADQQSRDAPARAIAITQYRLAAALGSDARARARTLAEASLATLQAADPKPEDHLAEARDVLQGLDPTPADTP